MSAVRAFLYGLLSFFVCGFAWLLVEPIFSVFVPMFMEAGGTAAFVGGLLATVFKYYPVLVIILICIGMFVGAMRDNEAPGGAV